MPDERAGDRPDDLRRITDRTASILACMGTDLRLRSWNPAFAHWLGADPDHLAGAPMESVLGPALYAESLPSMRAALAGTAQSFERFITGPGNAGRHALVNYSPDLEDGVVTGVVFEVLDVTPLKSVQTAAQRSAEYLRELFAMSSEAVLVADTAGRYTDTNEACCRMLGYSREELIGKVFDDLIEPHQADRLQQARGQIRAGQLRVEEWTLLRKDGTVVPVELRTRSMSDGRRVGFFHDISAHKHALDAEHEMTAAMEREVRYRTQELVLQAQKLKLSEARLRGILDAATDAIVTVDASHHIVQANGAATLMFRFLPEGLIGEPLDRLIPERFRSSHRDGVMAFGDAAVTARPMAPMRDVTALRADGEEFAVEASISHLTVDGRRLFTVILRDVTERKRAEAELRSSKAKLEVALASMNDAVCISDETGRLLEFNDAFVSFHRFASKAECKHTLAEYRTLFDTQQDNGEPARLDQWPVPRALRGEAASNVVYRLRRRDTGERWVGSYSFAPIRSTNGEIVGSVVAARDITSQRRAQAQLASSNATLRRLIAEHDKIQEEERKRIGRELHDDLQQTLAGIRIDLGLLRERLAVDPAAALPLVSEIDRMAQAAVASTRRIVNDLRPQMVEDLGLASALEELARQFTERTGIVCRLDANGEVGETPLDLPAVSTSLYRIAQEALNNVGKHARASRVEIGLTRTSDGLVLLRVSDNGIGMRKHDRRNPESFGLLGMAERVHALGGQLRIEGRVDAGTMVEVLVPTLRTRAAADPVPGDFGPTDDATRPGELDEGDTKATSLKDELGHPLQVVIDALAGSVSVIDSQGMIQLVNRAWREFAEHNGDPGQRASGPGVNYLEVCRRSAAIDPSTEPVLQGLNEVLTGRRMSYTTEYPCDTREGRNWFRMHAATVTGGITIVSHVNLTSRLGPEPPTHVDVEST